MLTLVLLATLAGACTDNAGESVDGPTGSSIRTLVVGEGTVPPPLPYNNDDVPIMKVVATEDGERYRFEAPEAVSAGPLGIEVENRGQQPHDLVVVKPKPTITMAQVTELLSGPSPEALPTIAQFLGGTAVVAPQAKQSAAMRLEPGEYFLLSMHRGADGRPDAAHGLYRKLAVAAPSDSVARRAKAPHDGAGVTITDDSIKLPDGFGVADWYKVANDGQQPHQLVVIKLNDGTKPDDAKAWLTAVETGPPPAPAPFSYLGGSSALDPGRSDSVRLDLGKGTFVAYCALPDRQNGFTPHFTKGVFVSFNRV